MKNVIILGSAGMAGHIMADYLNTTKEYKVYGVDIRPSIFTSKIMDVTSWDELKGYIKELKPHIIINCVGILVAQSKSNILTSILINSYLPNLLAEIGKESGFKLIHLSTDCVFSGKKGSYMENDFRDGDDNYARTKALGEIDNDKDLTIRTSIIGPEIIKNGTGLLDWFLKEKEDIHGFSNVYWSGVTTLELAKAVHEFIKQDIVGLYHLCPDNKISKYELLNIFNSFWSKKITIFDDDNYKSDKSLICTRTDFEYIVSDYAAMISDLYNWMKKRKDLYGHYGI